jgi:hypothetical protein
MALKIKIIDVNATNLREHPGVICFINPKNDAYKLKIEWLKEQFVNGLKIKLLYIEGEKSPKGFIEYMPGEHCWRAVNAGGYMFIHCIWTNGKKYQHHGLGKALITEVEKDAANMLGVAVMTSDGPFMASKEVFLKNGYTVAEESGKDQLLYKSFREAPAPYFKPAVQILKSNKGLILSYSRQCPWVSRFAEEIGPVLEKRKLDLTIRELKSYKEAQEAPASYGVFNLIHNDRILADRYISVTRFENIINKEFGK